MKNQFIKTLLFFLTPLFLNTSILAQVSINTDGSAPHASAILDIKSTNKGVLLPRMTTIQRTGLPNLLGLTVFDTDLNTPMFNNGSSWEPSSFKLPYSGTAVPGAFLPAFKILSEGSSGIAIIGETETNGVGVKGVSPIGYGLYGESASNIGVMGYTNTGDAGYFQSGLATGNALNISGKFYSNGSSGTNGSLYTVNVNGYPIWQEPVAFAVNDLGVVDEIIPHNTDIKLVFVNEEYDLGNDFNIISGEFTAPVKGIYHFDAFAYWLSHTNGAGFVSITLFKNNSIYSTVRAPALSNEGISNTMSVNILLNAGDKMTCYAFQNSGVNQTLDEDGRLVKFSGYLVARQ